MKWLAFIVRRDEIIVRVFRLSVRARDLSRFPPWFSEQKGYTQFYDLVWKKARVRVTFLRNYESTDFLFRSRP